MKYNSRNVLTTIPKEGHHQVIKKKTTFIYKIVNKKFSLYKQQKSFYLRLADHSHDE